MNNNLITENTVKSILNKILNEETSKVKRDDFSRVQFKIEELQNSLNETIKELRKLEDSIPSGLKTISNGRIVGISNNFGNAQKLISQLKEKIKQHKKTTYKQQVEVKGK
jgi:flagellar biosynthesis chaperone FliJ